MTIDLDDTLWPCMPTIMHAENTSYAWLQQNLPDITSRYSIDDLRDKRKALMRQQPDLVNDLSAARRAHFRELADELGYHYDWIDEGFKVFHDARQKVEFYADVIPVLERLQAHFKLVALTNGNADIEKVGLGEFFDLQVSAADVAAAKPHPAMFIEAMNQLGMKPEQTLHVGDHEVHDIQGARHAGIRSVWINRQGTEWQTADYSADFEIADLYGLLKLLMD
ncbi:MAG: HAD family hydrolase [Gammaproteobacteria bacterium]|nr:HAD family hydrolase [Gammaproteobacteria bacterium]